MSGATAKDEGAEGKPPTAHKACRQDRAPHAAARPTGGGNRRHKPPPFSPLFLKAFRAPLSPPYLKRKPFALSFAIPPSLYARTPAPCRCSFLQSPGDERPAEEAI